MLDSVKGGSPQNQSENVIKTSFQVVVRNTYANISEKLTFPVRSSENFAYLLN